MEIDINGNFIQHQLYEPPVKTGYEAWRISYQSSEQAARAAFNEVSALTTERNELRARLLQKMDDCVKAEKQNEQLRQRVAELETQLAKNNPLLDEAADAIDKLTAERDALKQQRDELVVAATKAAEEIRKCDYTPARSTLLVAIASVKEK